jgi:hypothetical protein
MSTKTEKNVKGCFSTLVILFVIFTFAAIIINSCLNYNNCKNCGGDGVIKVYGIKSDCPKCHPKHRDWSNPK